MTYASQMLGQNLSWPSARGAGQPLLPIEALGTRTTTGSATAGDRLHL